MESHNKSWIMMSYLAAAALFGYILFSLGLFAAGTWDLETKIRNIELVLQLTSLGLAGLLYLYLYRNERTNQFMNEVVTELGNVTWPTQKETLSATWVVMIMVLISGMILGLMDYFWTTLLQWVL